MTLGLLRAVSISIVTHLEEFSSESSFASVKQWRASAESKKMSQM